MEKFGLIPHLFRSEYSKIVAVLAKRFGLDQIEIAEDLASETFLTAAQTWSIEGPPKNPTAWLYQVAKNKGINYLKRQTHFNHKLLAELKTQFRDTAEDEIDLSDQNITDSQLQMIFAVCHPSISIESQIGLCLRILCGFGIDEIAAAFLTPKDTINKRLFRAKEKLREEKIKLELPDSFSIESRLDAVLTTIYLLFNEGYYSVSQDSAIRKDLCLEAIRLCSMLIENETTNQFQVNALMALMCFHISRFDARLGSDGGLILYEEQDTDLWNLDWIHKGAYFLNQSAKGNVATKYHLEAGIAYWHTQKTDHAEKWESILQLYNQLLQLEYSPIAALNRTYALSKARGTDGKRTAIKEAEKLKLTDHSFYFLLLGELYIDMDNEMALQHFTQAFILTKTPIGKQSIQNKIDKLRSKSKAI